MSTVLTPTDTTDPTKYIARAKALVPLLRENARRTDQERRVPQENTEAIDIIRQASGAHGIYQTQNSEIIFRDAAALASHALMMPTTGIEHYGRALCGLEPNTPWL